MSTPINVGDTSIDEIPGARLIVKRGEASQLIRPFQGAVENLAAFLDDNQTGVSTDYQYPTMVLDQIDAIENGAAADVKLIYFGNPSPQSFFKPTDLLTDVTWEPHSAVICTTVSADGHWLVNYYSPTVTYRYCIETMYDTPQYAGFTTNPTGITILSPFAASNGDTVGPFNQYPTGPWAYQLTAVCTGFKRIQKGNIYNYLETQAVILSLPTAASGGSLYNLSPVTLEFTGPATLPPLVPPGSLS